MKKVIERLAIFIIIINNLFYLTRPLYLMHPECNHVMMQLAIVCTWWYRFFTHIGRYSIWRTGQRKIEFSTRHWSIKHPSRHLTPLSHYLGIITTDLSVMAKYYWNNKEFTTASFVDFFAWSIFFSFQHYAPHFLDTTDKGLQAFLATRTVEDTFHPIPLFSKISSALFFSLIYSLLGDFPWFYLLILKHWHVGHTLHLTNY